MKLLVVIDMQNDFITGALGNKECRAIVPNVVEKVNNAVNPEARISVDAHCCAGVTPESHKNALEAMKMCQINIKEN